MNKFENKLFNTHFLGMGRCQMMTMSPAVSGGAGSPASSTSSGGLGTNSKIKKRHKRIKIK